MGIRVSQADSASLIGLEGVIDISIAAELSDALAQAIGAGGPVTIDLAGVTSLDVTAWQLLWAIRRDAARNTFECAFAGKLPDSVLRFLSSVGLADPTAPETAMQE